MRSLTFAEPVKNPKIPHAVIPLNPSTSHSPQLAAESSCPGEAAERECRIFNSFHYLDIPSSAGMTKGADFQMSQLAGRYCKSA
jgi:hypothetical protein